MNPERWSQIKDLFEQAAARPAAARADFLATACEGDEDLRAEVESLLAADAEIETHAANPVAKMLGTALRPVPEAGRRFGVYRVEREIGRGGMAVVYAAVRDDDQYRQQVAIKLIKRGMDTDALVARFRQERQILANLEHPNIARLLDGGVSDDGLPYLVMEHIEGLPIDVYCDEQALPIAERLRLFRTVAGAVQYAHRNLVVHRDLKPSNILVTPAGVPKLLDFGIAKLLASEEPAEVEVTAAGQRAMTPGYASPEQLRGAPITTASDIYSLGILLYLLLTDRRPYQLQGLTAREIERIVCEQEPERPSSAVGRGAALPDERSRARRLRRLLAGDLDTIVLKALHKDPERRYGSAEQLAEDLRRHLEGLPVLARPDTFAYRAGKFVRRHSWGVAAALLITLSLVAGIVATTHQAEEARRERETAQWVSNFMVDLFEIAQPGEGGGDITVQQMVKDGVRQIPRGASENPEIQATLQDTLGLTLLKLGDYEGAAPLLEEALALHRAHRGVAHVDTLRSRNNVAELRTRQARYDEAEVMLRENLDLAHGVLGEEHVLVADSEENLGIVLYRQNRHDEAEVLLRQSLARRQRVQSAEHRDVAQNLNNLALVPEATYRLEEAASLYRAALAMNQELLGDEHPMVAVNYNNLAQILRQQEDCDEAIVLYEKALAIQRRVLGDDHAGLAITRNNIAGCLTDIGRFEEAETHHLAALTLRRAALGEEHPRVAESLNNLARTYLRWGKVEEAESLFRQVLAINRQGGESLALARSLNSLANTLVRRGADLDAAEAFFREAMKLNQELGGGDLAVARNHYNLGNLLMRRKKYEAAAPEFQRALGLRRGVLGDDHSDVAASRGALGVALVKSGRPQEAEPQLREAIRLWGTTPEERWQHLERTRSQLGACLTALGRYEEAETLLVSSYEVLAARLGATSAGTVLARERVIELYASSGRPGEAARYRAMGSGAQ